MSLAQQASPAADPSPDPGLGAAVSPAVAPAVLRYDQDGADEAYRFGPGETPELPNVSIAVGPLTIEVHAADEALRFTVKSAAASYRAAQKDLLPTLRVAGGAVVAEEGLEPPTRGL